MNVLVLYYSRRYPLKATIHDYLYSLERYSGARCYYANLGMARMPSALQRVRYDLVVFQTILLWERVDPHQFRAICDRAAWVADLDCPKVALPQDEYLQGDELELFIERFGVTHVMSCAQPDEWSRLYPRTDREKVAFSNVLTGYLSEDTLARIARMAVRAGERAIDIGYRAWDPWPSLGRHGLLKAKIGDMVKERAPAHALKSDVSSAAGDTLLGDAWYEFLLRCRYTLGVEGGASVLDYDGSLMRATLAFLGQHPDATFDEVEEACFPGRDGEISYFAISPRHLEACATRTCQVLVEGRYNGILQPGVHYIELRRDLSNLDDVLETVRIDGVRAQIVERAYHDVVGAGDWTYRRLAEAIIGVADSESSAPNPSALEVLIHFANQALDHVVLRLWGWAWAVRRMLESALGRKRVAEWTGRLKRRLGETA
jgi:hypothetical protein